RRPNDPGIHYRVTADPGGVRVSVPSADLFVTDIAGELVMEDGILTLRDLHGRAAGGEIRADAVLDFKDTPVKLQFDRVVARGLDVHKLPSSWNVPKQFGGQLVGQARVTVTIRDGKVQTTGAGDAHLENAQVLGQPAEVRLQLTSGPQGLKFEQKQSAAGPPV